MNVNDYASELTSEDFAISSTLHDLQSLNRILDRIKTQQLNSMIDMGCGYGGLTTYIARYLNVIDIHGVDANTNRLSQAKLRGINVHELDLNKAELPLPDESFDLVTSFGVLEHLIYFDSILKESWRVLRKGGYLIIAMPNLANYVNRIALLFGYQPRDVEISSEVQPVILPFYARRDHIFQQHVHSATLRATKQLLRYYRFHLVRVGASAPFPPNTLIKLVDKAVSPFPSLSRRFIILGKKAHN